MRIANWSQHLLDKQEELRPVRNFSMVYKHYSQIDGGCMYVGRSDSALTRPPEYTNNRNNVLPRTGRAHNFVQYKIFTGASKQNEAFDEECRVFHDMSEAYQNERDHPAKPHGSVRRCPVQWCDH